MIATYLVVFYTHTIQEVKVS